MAKKITKKVVISKAVIAAVHKGLDAAERAKAPLQAMGATIATEYGKRETLEAIRSQFIADVILPMKRYAEQAKVIAAPLGKKGTPEGEAIRAAKANARATVGMAFGLILKYAFPKEKTTQEKRVNPEHVKIAKHLDAALKIARDSSSGMFDAVKLTGAIKIALAMLPRAIEPSTTEPGRRTPTTPKAPTKRKAPRNANKNNPHKGLGAPKQKTRNARKAKPKTTPNIINARELVGATQH